MNLWELQTSIREVFVNIRYRTWDVEHRCGRLQKLIRRLTAKDVAHILKVKLRQVQQLSAAAQKGPAAVQALRWRRPGRPRKRKALPYPTQA